MKHLVVFSGSGISAESGIPTFRDSGGLWEGFKVEDVATPEAWRRNLHLVQDFYNQRRKQALQAMPNKGHQVIAELEDHFKVSVITQNVDNLHERAGSSRVIHLHGNLFESRSSIDETLIYPIDGWELKMGALCEKGSQLRPNIVWFGELVPMIEVAAKIVTKADLFIVVGTSLVVYPAAGLVDYVPFDTSIFVIDTKPVSLYKTDRVTHILAHAGKGLTDLKEILIRDY